MGGNNRPTRAAYYRKHFNDEVLPEQVSFEALLDLYCLTSSHSLYVREEDVLHAW